MVQYLAHVFPKILAVVLMWMIQVRVHPAEFPNSIPSLSLAVSLFAGGRIGQPHMSLRLRHFRKVSNILKRKKKNTNLN